MKFSGLIILLLLAIHCKEDEVIKVPIGIDEESFMNTPLLPSTLNQSFLMDDGTSWKCRLTVTEEILEQKLPFVIALHYAGDEMSFQTYSDCLPKPAFADLPCILLAPEDKGLGWEHESNRDRIASLIDLAKQHWPIDSSKIVITGYSNGGIGTWKFASEFADQISAAIPMGGYFKDPIKFDIPIYTIQGELDELFPPDQLNETIKASEAMGSNITFIVAEGLSHYETCSYVSFLKDAVEWLSQEVW